MIGQRVEGPRKQDTELVQVERLVDTVISGIIRAWKRIMITIAVLTGLYLIAAPFFPGAWQYVLYGLLLLFQLFFAIIFMIVQFVALFWFLGRPRMYWIMPGETGVGFKDYKGNP
ncbi:MAG: ATPase, partial [Chloroflexi bacterium]|nr:ATPase [Chloroflexota bacterium]